MRMNQTLAGLGTLGIITVVTACGGQTATSDEPAEMAVEPLAQTVAGELEGAWADESAGVSVFRGIAFAKPPVGDLRWRPPPAVESCGATTPHADCATPSGGSGWGSRRAAERSMLSPQAPPNYEFNRIGGNGALVSA